MLSEREYMREVRPRFLWPATLAIMVMNVMVFIVKLFIDRTDLKEPFEAYFALSLDGMKSGYFWQLLTFQFLHANFWHIFFNMWAIFMFGREVELNLGKVRMVVLYLASGIGGGVLQMLCAFLLPRLVGDFPVVGASAGAFGLITAYAVLFPDRMLMLLLFFVLP